MTDSMAQQQERVIGIGDNSGKADDVDVLDLVRDKPGLIYETTELLGKIAARIEDDLAKRVVNLETDAGRDEIRSYAASISRIKVPIVDAGKKLTEEWRKQTASVNAIKTKVETTLDGLRDKAREPLTKWEADKKRRDEISAQLITRIDALCTPRHGITTVEIDANLQFLDGIKWDDLGDFFERAQVSVQQARAALTTLRPVVEKAENDAAELETLRKQRAEQEREAQKRNAEIAAEALKANAANQAKLDEATRQEQERQREAAAKAAREADEAHRAAVRNNIIADLMLHAGAKKPAAENLADILIAGSIRNVTVNF